MPGFLITRKMIDQRLRFTPRKILSIEALGELFNYASKNPIEYALVSKLEAQLAGTSYSLI